MIWFILLLLQLCMARPAHDGPPSLSTISQLAQFPNPTWVETVAVRSNGKLLVTLVTSPDLYQIDPSLPDSTPTLVATFPEALAVLGIAEIEPDVFAITSGNFSIFTGEDAPGSWSVWKADFRGQSDQSLASISKITTIPEAIFLNGVTTVQKGSKILLMADSLGGVLWRLNYETGQYDVVLNNTATQLAKPFAEGGFGINGVHTRSGFLYFTNSDLGLMRVRLCEDGTPAGDVETLATFVGGDDFAFDGRGNTYVARGRVDIIDRITPTGEVQPLNFTNADGLVLSEGSTSVAFGRTKNDLNRLYVTTNGGLTGLVNGTEIQGGRVLAIDL